LICVNFSFLSIVQASGIAKAGTDTSGTGNALTLTFSHTLVAGSNRLVVVCFAGESDGGLSVSSVTYGGTAMTLAVSLETPDSGFKYIGQLWYILEANLPANGANNVVITTSGSTSSLEVNAYCSEYTGVAQTAPEATNSVYTTSSATITNTLTASAGAWVISTAGSGNAGSWTAGSPQVEAFDFNDASSCFCVDELQGATGGSISLSSTYSSTVNRITRVCASFAAAAGGVTVDHFAINTIGSQVAGTPFSITITAAYANGSTVTGYSGTALLTCSSGSITPNSTSGGFVNGVWTGSVTITGAGSSVSIHAADGSAVGDSNTFIVSRGSLAKLVVSSGTSQVAGTPFNVNVTATDAYGNIVTDYAGTVAITSDDTAAVLPPSAGLTSGSGTFSVTLKTAGAKSVTATDTVTSSVTGSAVITVTHAGASNVVITPAGATVAAGTMVTYTATATDAYSNTWDATSSTTWSISSGAHGSWVSNNYTSATPGTWTVTATHASTNYTTTLTVNAGSLHHFIVVALSSAMAGTAFTLTVTAVDAGNNTITTYSSATGLSASSGTINPTTTGTSGWVGGVWTSSSVTLTAAGSITITANDGSGHTGTSGSITVSHGSVSSVRITPAGTSVTSGSAVTYSATANDTYNNTWDVTSSTTFSINSTAGGSWSSNVYTTANVGTWTVVGRYSGTNYTTTLTVTTAPTPTPTPGGGGGGSSDSGSSSGGTSSTPTPAPTATPTPTPTPPPTNTATSTVTVSNNSATADQSATTGVSVTVSGSSLPNGVDLNITSINYSGNQPSGTGSVSVGSAVYFDVSVFSSSGALGSDVFVLVTIKNSAFSSASVIQYWDGNAWVSVATAFTAPDTVSATIPASALTGTPIVVGTQVSNPPIPLTTILAIVVVAVVILGALLFYTKRKKK